MDADKTLCVYCTATNSVIDVLRPLESATTALQRLSPEYGTKLEVLALNEAWRRSEASCVTQPKEIAEKDFHEMLSILPPVGWRHGPDPESFGDAESFKMVERVTGNITAIYVRLGDRYFTFQDDIRTKHEECCGRVRASEAYKARKAYAEKAADEGNGVAR